MTKEYFTKIMIALGTAYNKEFNQSQITVWYDFFKETKAEEFKKAISRIISQNKFLPSIAEVKQEIANITISQLQLDPEEEWQKVLKAIRSFDIYDGEKALGSLNEYTAKIVKMIGWYRLCMSENITWEKKEFIKLFTHKNEKLVKYETLGNNLTNQELTYKEQILLEEKEIDKQNLLEMEGLVYE